MDFRLRQATPEDAEAVVLMQTLAHEECYAHLLSGKRNTLPPEWEELPEFRLVGRPQQGVGG